MHYSEYHAVGVALFGQVVGISINAALDQKSR